LTAQDLDTGRAERAKLRRELSRLDTIFFLISAMVVVDTIGAIAIGGGQAFTWLVALFVAFFIPSALASAELGAGHPRRGRGLCVGADGLGRFFGGLSQSALYVFGTVFVGLATLGAVVPLRYGKWLPACAALLLRRGRPALDRR
jgi:glutamate:GABA antiporter